MLRGSASIAPLRTPQNMATHHGAGASQPGRSRDSLALDERTLTAHVIIGKEAFPGVVIVSEFESLRTGERVAPGPQARGQAQLLDRWKELRSAGSTETPWFITTDRLGDSLESTSTRRKRLAQLAWQRGAGEVDGGCPNSRVRVPPSLSEDLRNASYAIRWRQPSPPLTRRRWRPRPRCRPHRTYKDQTRCSSAL